MPIVGTREQIRPGSQGYATDPMHAYAKEFLDVVNSIKCEGYDYFTEAKRVMMNPSLNETMRDFFIENSYDASEFQGDAEALEEHLSMMNEMYTNDKEAVLEHSTSGEFNPVIGMTFPIHKNIMMNNVFDKGVIPKFVATAPKFTVSMETRWLIDPVTGEKIDFWREQYKMTDIVDKVAPLKSMYLALPESEQTNVLEQLFGRTSKHDHLSIETHLSGIVGDRAVFPSQTIQVAVSRSDTNFTPAVVTTDIINWTNTSDTAVVVKKDATLTGVTGTVDKVTTTVIGGVFEWKGLFTPSYGTYDRTVMEQFAVPAITSIEAGDLDGTWNATVTLPDGSTQVVKNITSENGIDPVLRTRGFISGFMKEDKFGLTTSNANVSGVILTAKYDTSSGLVDTASVSWSVRTDIIEIPEANPINVTVSPEEVKDIGALYQINQLTKVMSLIKITLGNYKDDKIRRGLDESFVRIPNDCKIGRQIDFAPPANYALDPIEWRQKTFMDALDTHVTQLLHILNDPNMTFNIIGRDDLIRKITPTDYTYQSPANIGPVELDFVKTVVTSDKRTYQFISSDKLRDTNNLMIIPTPKNSERFIYRLFDYQMYISNEIRNAGNTTLPSIHAFERWVLKEYQPIQGRIRILNPTGLRNYATDYAFNLDPIGRGDGRGVASVGKNDFDIDAR